MTKLLLDSGNLSEYNEIIKLSKEKNSEIWGATTNPTLIAKALSGKKLTREQAFKMQKEIVLEILKLVPGPVSAEVYADLDTVSSDMIKQGEEIASWDKRIYVKLPTTLEGLKARKVLREQNIPINNTLVFTLEQILAITLQENILRQNNKASGNWLPFISPFIGRLDDHGQNGMQLIFNALKLINQLKTESGETSCWLLASSIRTIKHLKDCMDLDCPSITAPAKVYKEWFNLPKDAKEKLGCSHFENDKTSDILYSKEDLTKITSYDELIRQIESKNIDITNELTTSGIKQFVLDWNSLFSN